jgi:uncharacterized DUF497 family protein
MERIAGFDWDDGNRAKCEKHGVSIEEIESVFYGWPVIASDMVHSRSEMRVRAVGRTSKGRFIFVVFTIRKDRLIRPISARYMHRKEIRRYEEDLRAAEAVSRLQDR